jgi:hypothetical protein
MSDSSWTRPTWAPRMPLLRHKCPSCTSTQFKAAELRPFDFLFSLFLLFPVRCKSCWRRFYWVSLSGAPTE